MFGWYYCVGSEKLFSSMKIPLLSVASGGEFHRSQVKSQMSAFSKKK